MLVWGTEEVCAGHEYVGGTRGSGILSSAADVLCPGMIGAGGVCEMCMYSGGVGDKRVSR